MCKEDILKEWMDERFQAQNGKFADQKSRLIEIKERVDRTNGRVKSLEKWRWGLSGAISVLVFLFSIFGTIVFACLE